MSLFDSLKDSASGLIGSEAHTALTDALAKSPLGDVSGLLDKLHEGGLDSAVEAWSNGEDHPPVSPDELHQALGDEHVQHLADSMGVSADQLLAGLSEHLPALAAHDDADDAHHDDDAHDDADDAHHDDDAHDAADHEAADLPAAEVAHAEADEDHESTDAELHAPEETETVHDEEPADA